jgi:hypothetical protein
MMVLVELKFVPMLFPPIHSELEEVIEYVLLNDNNFKEILSNATKICHLLEKVHNCT